VGVSLIQELYYHRQECGVFLRVMQRLEPVDKHR
jgi:hypothetical protein